MSSYWGSNPFTNYSTMPYQQSPYGMGWQNPGGGMFNTNALSGFGGGSGSFGGGMGGMSGFPSWGMPWGGMGGFGGGMGGFGGGSPWGGMGGAMGGAMSGPTTAFAGAGSGMSGTPDFSGLQNILQAMRGAMGGQQFNQTKPMYLGPVDGSGNKNPYAPQIDPGPGPGPVMGGFPSSAYGGLANAVDANGVFKPALDANNLPAWVTQAHSNGY